jgi:hypothetical protein
MFEGNFQKIILNKAISYCWPFSHFLLYGIGKNLVLRFKINSFDRFNTKPKPLAKILARILLFQINFCLFLKLEKVKLLF